MGPVCEHVDFAVSTDLVSSYNPPGAEGLEKPALSDEGLEANVQSNVNVNTGVYFVKATVGGKNLMKKWAALREVMKHENDQVGMYCLLRHTPSRDDRTKLTRSLPLLRNQVGMYRLLRHTPSREDRALRRLVYEDMGGSPTYVGLLSVGMLLNGYSYFIPKLHEALKVKPLGVHMTWLPLCKEGKFHRMRDGMLYHDPPEYYTEPMFITAGSEAMIQVHLKLMDKQLWQVYRVMAIALLLNRTLVFPKLHCFCYKNWFMSEQCRIPGDRVTHFPMKCDMDQWLRPKIAYNYGPNIIGEDGPHEFFFREYTMLDNTRFPQELRNEVDVVAATSAQELRNEVDVVAATSAQVKTSTPSMFLLSRHPQPFPKELRNEVDVVVSTTACTGSDCNILNRTRDKTLNKDVAYVPKGMTQKQIIAALAPLKNEKVIRLKGAFDMFAGFDDLKLKDSSR
eukprot:gene21186-28086_t